MREALNSSPQVQTVGLDVMTHLYPFLGSLIEKTYVEILKHTPQIWDYLYDNPDIAEITREIRQFFSFIDTPKFKSLLNEFRPDVFVCTHALPSGLIAEQKRRGNCDLPLIAIVTDYEVHSYWAHPQVDRYLVANENSRQSLISRGVAEKKIRVCGIPIASAFSKKIPAKEAKKKLGLDASMPAILIMGGTRGMGPIKKAVHTLLNLDPSLQILAAAGSNEKLKSELVPLAQTGKIHLFEPTDSISLLMDAADILITKPGGMTSSEALVKGLPMILIHPIPGQEERNARYLTRHGAAVECSDLKDLAEKTAEFIRHPEKLGNMSKKMLNISTPRSAQAAAEEILLLSTHEILRAH